MKTFLRQVVSIFPNHSLVFYGRASHLKPLLLLPLLLADALAQAHTVIKACAASLPIQPGKPTHRPPSTSLTQSSSISLLHCSSLIHLVGVESVVGGKSQALCHPTASQPAQCHRRRDVGSLGHTHSRPIPQFAISTLHWTITPAAVLVSCFPSHITKLIQQIAYIVSGLALLLCLSVCLSVGCHSGGT